MKHMQEFEKQFEEFCKSPGIDSGKARSYVKAIRYLCDYMEIKEINSETISKLKLVETTVNDKNSLFYKELNEFLRKRRQASYLEKGFVRAALKYLFIFKMY